MRPNDVILLNARSMTAGYSDSEDRLWLRFSGDAAAVQMWVTRQRLMRCLPLAWDVLAQSSALPTGLTGSPLTRRAALLAEREVALEKPAEKAAVAPPAKATRLDVAPLQAGLLSSLRLEPGRQFVRMAFRANAGTVSMSCTRQQVHRLLTLLVRRAESCDWAVIPPWAAV